ncbi:MAG: Crp/Fnr family transcriptional regulator [Candidatus Bipolaricaulota bacterium]|nr:Crp/Fnr family transcriptional regulator [Candidatus Bipolaricaulota bacterium]
MEKTSTSAETPRVDWKRAVETYKPLHVRYPHGELVFQIGTYAAGTYLVSAGLVSDRCAAQGERHRTPPIEILGPGDLIGLEVLLDRHRDLHLSCARAVTDAELFFFERELFLQVLEQEAGIERYCLAYLARRFYSMKQRTGLLFTSRVEERLAQLLLDLAERCGERLDGENVTLPCEITLPILAQLLGRSAARVGRATESLPGISQQGERLVVSSDALRAHLAETADLRSRARGSPR